MTATLSPWRVAATRFRPKQRKWASPGAMASAIDRGHRQTAMLARIDQELVELFDGQDDRGLMIFTPPQEGKSERVSRRTPAWLLAHDPTLRIAIISYSADKAVRWGKQILRDVRTHPELGITLRKDAQTAGRWETEQGGRLFCVGIQGGITGEPVDVMVIDDPVEGRAEAESATYREAAWDWWESNASTRQSSRFRVLLMMTRWHEDDLAGRLLARERGRWRVLRIPAIAEEDDPLGRRPGEELASVQRRRPGYFHQLKELRSAYVFSGIYQQAPTVAEGNLFRRSDFRFWYQMPPDPSRHGPLSGGRIDLGGRAVALDDCWRFLTIDLAASTRTSADWTVASVWAISPDGDLILLDRRRARIEEAEHWDLVRPLRERWAADTVFVEAGWIGTTLVIDATASGVPVQPLTADTDKLTRALPATSRVKAHRVWFPAGASWLDEWCDELAGFPSAQHDDQVDTLSYAARVVTMHWVRQDAAGLGGGAAASTDAAIEQAYTAATGGDTGGIDFMSLDY
ncbi:phage terminase large subunit [Nonomuraea angiospora]|uniref:phage terminase large subunit n=1 Tax=Nonomuraea angiospora TaxID=46172 RepID=UPI0029B102E4|nr:phage terminase large subunit [Nonomuraea angiospora]MDX3100455.1 phage terminase large subunit [Nonomuraea angiospora]